MRQHIRYLLTVLMGFALVILPVVVLNYILGIRTFGGDDVVEMASRWQEATHGVTYAPPENDSAPFKSARLLDRLPQINTVVFGSSTMMSITDKMFPEDMKTYNFAQNAHSLSDLILEAESLQRLPGATLKWFVIPLDWSIGYLYRKAPFPREDPARVIRAVSAVPKLDVLQQLKDALAIPRLRNLLSILARIARSPKPLAAFREVFMQRASDDYRCTDGTPAKDFDTLHLGTCTGFRYDGSATFASFEPVSVNRARTLIARAVMPTSRYADAGLLDTAGEVNPLLLERLADLARNLAESDGDLVLVLPPLLPGMERAFLDAPWLAPALQRTKQQLDAWARSQGLTIIDAGQSERYGCTVSEFVDEHHALPSCYMRIFGRFWPDRRDARLRPGLYSPVQQDAQTGGG